MAPARPSPSFDAYADPALIDTTSSNFSSSDLAQFDQEFDLPDPPGFTVLNQFGTDIGGTKPIPRPATDPTGTWEATEALDVEWAHAIAPGASIILIECNSDGAADLFDGSDDRREPPRGLGGLDQPELGRRNPAYPWSIKPSSPRPGTRA